jgi:integrase
MPVYKKGAKWRVVIWSNGKRHDWILEGSKKEANQFEAGKKVLLLSRDPKNAERVAPTILEFCETYRSHAKQHLRPLTYTNRIYKLATVAAAFEGLRLTEITLARIDQYKEMRLEEDGVQPSTLNDELKVLRTLLRHAKDCGFQCQDLRIKDVPQPGRANTRAWTTQEVGRLLKSVHKLEPRIMPLVMFLLHTGCRKGEAIALEWKDVDLAGRLFKIEPSKEWQPKDNEAREIPIDAALLPYLKGKRLHPRWVFPSTDGDRFQYWPQRYFDRARDAAGLIGGPHTCRHTYASHFLRSKPNMFLLGRILGHSTSYVTERYAHMLPEHLAEARDIVSYKNCAPHRAQRGKASHQQRLRKTAK